jgi:hypothetical protein
MKVRNKSQFSGSALRYKHLALAEPSSIHLGARLAHRVELLSDALRRRGENYDNETEKSYQIGMET